MPHGNRATRFPFKWTIRSCASSTGVGMNIGNKAPEGPEEKKQKPLYTSGMDKKKTSHLRVRCPCCEAVLTVERSNGEVLFTEKPKKKGVSFEDAVLQVQKEKDTTDDRFRDAFTREQS